MSALQFYETVPVIARYELREKIEFAILDKECSRLISAVDHLEFVSVFGFT